MVLQIPWHGGSTLASKSATMRRILCPRRCCQFPDLGGQHSLQNQQPWDGFFGPGGVANSLTRGGSTLATNPPTLRRIPQSWRSCKIPWPGGSTLATKSATMRWILWSCLCWQFPGPQGSILAANLPTMRRILWFCRCCQFLDPGGPQYLQTHQQWDRFFGPVVVADSWTRVNIRY
jgi:hypothetical protein